MVTFGAIARLSVLFLVPSIGALGQTHTTGRIAGTVKDQTGAVIRAAEVTVISRATGEERKAITDTAGKYAVPFLLPGDYQVNITASGFKKLLFENVKAVVTETTTTDAELLAGTVSEEVTIHTAAALIQTDGPQLGRVIDARTASELPTATRNFTHLLGLSPGVAAFLPDNSTLGRNSQNVSVNGARLGQNNFQINGMDASAGTPSLQFADPAPETIQEFKVQTSLYDASFGHAGGGQIQVITKSGANDFHGAAYEYFGNDALNANNPFLKAAGATRPVLKRNIFGATLGGPLQKNKSFFFVSYQGIRERNGAIRNSLSSNVLIAGGLTDDRSEETLVRTFSVASINPVALGLLNARSPEGSFLIPTPQADGRYSGSAASRFREDQFNTNVDYKVSERNWMAVKFFFSDAPQTRAIDGAANVPGFPTDVQNNSRFLSVQDIHTFNSRVTNEARFGYNFISGEVVTRQSIKDTDIGIARSTADDYPGLPLIGIATSAGGILFGTSALLDFQAKQPSLTFADALSITRGSHRVRTGAEIRHREFNRNLPILTFGVINFDTFNDFLIGKTASAVLANGVPGFNLRATDYSFYIQDDWKFASRLTINLGLRYELGLSPYDTRGRIATFDTELYRPPLPVSPGTPIGPPAGGLVQAGNAIPEFDLPDVPNVGKRVLRSIDPNNFAPRVGIAYSPFESARLVLRGGYGIYYSRKPFSTIVNTVTSAPFHLITARVGAPFEDPFFPPPREDQFPVIPQGVLLSGSTLDRNMRTPYVHQYGASVQYLFTNDMMSEVAYVGTRGLSLLRQVAINQARLASPDRPIINEVTGAVITTNTSTNAGLRAPFQGIVTGNTTSGFLQNQTTAQSTYHSLQASLTRRLSRGLQLLTAYTYAKSIDNASGGVSATGGVSDTGAIQGDQTDNRANRGVSDFDRTHRVVLGYLWELPEPVFARRSNVARLFFSRWQIGGIVTAMSGLPIDIVDGGAATFYLGQGGGGARPNWAPGATLGTATSSVPPGYFFNPFAFARPIVLAGQVIPSSSGTATAAANGTDFGNVGRNVLRGPWQTNVDFSIIKRFRIAESKNIEFRAEFFNLFNQVNLANPISNLNAVPLSGGSFDPATGRIISPGDFGRIISTSNNPRLIQFALKFNY
jgi:hypothetical protein